MHLAKTIQYIKQMKDQNMMEQDKIIEEENENEQSEVEYFNLK